MKVPGARHAAKLSQHRIAWRDAVPNKDDFITEPASVYDQIGILPFDIGARGQPSVANPRHIELPVSLHGQRIFRAVLKGNAEHRHYKSRQCHSPWYRDIAAQPLQKEKN